MLEVVDRHTDLLYLGLVLRDSPLRLVLSMLEMFVLLWFHRILIPNFGGVVDSLVDTFEGCYFECIWHSPSYEYWTSICAEIFL